MVLLMHSVQYNKLERILFGPTGKNKDFFQNLATTNQREDPGRFTRKVEDGGASGLISPLLDHRI